MKQPPFSWFDAHLDLAYMAVSRRNMDLPPEDAGGPDLPAAVTLPSLTEGRVRHCLATVFTEPDGADPAFGYKAGNIEAAAAVGRRQLDVYDQWAATGKMRIGGPPSENVEPLQAWILVEGADPIRNPEEVAQWQSRGVAAIGLAWAKPSRYAGGNMTDTGLSPVGRDMVIAIDEAGIIHDLSHLSDRATDELLSIAKGPIMASHSNCRALVNDGSAGGPVGSTTATTPSVPPFQRHLRDDVIREIGRRGGIVGINLFSPFLVRGGVRSRRATISEVVAHINRVCTLTGSKRHVGLGSDMDGGFSALTLPEGLDRPKDLGLLATALMENGWSRSETEGFAFENWVRFIRENAKTSEPLLRQ